ncbi:ATP-dependent protease [Bradyrhizobium sp. CCBAU 051011]|uniref:Lon protease family protein n=1 Tax=Bradyrhizobium sp. CCBAU 051011 TaxID=858422 RepID=UPI001373ADE0|nr:ATP-binding protein [Bradyrhizobium sp. CCBAU 051011]QHO75588.1 ATP-dependent protease [Bradyrhizobium sp. CCBAU 051011]
MANDPAPSAALRAPEPISGPAISLSADAKPAPLPAAVLYRYADASALNFQTTTDLQPLDGLVGQQRALGALQLGTKLNKPGFNLFVTGSAGSRMQKTVESLLKSSRWDRPRPDDWVYVNNFEDSRKPVAIRLPPGRATELRSTMEEVIEDLKVALPALFESDDYQARRTAIEQKFQSKQSDAFSSLSEKAASASMTIVRTPMGFVIAPVRDGKLVEPDEFNAWPEADQKAAQDTIAALQNELEQIVRHVPGWEKEHREEIQSLDRQTALVTIDQSINEAKDRFSTIAEVLKYFESVRADLIENTAIFLAKPQGELGAFFGAALGKTTDRYHVNVLVSQDPNGSIPIIEELHPTLGNLIGSIEYVSQHGFLVTDFRLIKAGALHRANGGFLLLDARHLLSEPFSWQALKRLLRQQEIRIEDVTRFVGLTNSVSLEPDPIPLDLKVILFGDRLLYYLLSTYDPEVGEFFKVLADFEDDIDRTPSSEAMHAQLIASLLAQEHLQPMDRDGVALVLEHSSRLADDSEKLTLLTDRLKDILAEADFWAGEAKHDITQRHDVQRALDEGTTRMSRIRDRAKDAVLRDISLVDTKVGQINGLSVFELGGFRFGRPTRITCRVRPGSGKLVDIEREVELGGPIHSKGVLILTGFLAGRYALDTPMSLFASLVFEQSYGGVEGDSASSAELYALMSALADIPLQQDLAVTGSVNQNGEVQAIGGVNEKIEGFFDICTARGLTGKQGVLIPKSNVQHLMLRRDVISACTVGTFSIYPIGTIDEGITLLTGRAAGSRSPEGAYAVDSINGLIESRLRSFARTQELARKALSNGQTET